MGTGGGGQNSADIAIRARLEGEQALRKAQDGLEGLEEASKGAAKAQGELSEASNETSNIGQQLTGVFDALDDKLGEFGLNIRAVTVALGAGLAGGITAFLRAAVVGIQAISGFIGDLIADERRFERDTFATFSSASDSVRKFAEDASRDLQRTRGEINEIVNDFGAFANALRIPSNEAQQFSENLTVLAGAVVNLAPGAKSAAEAADLIQRAIQGSEEALVGLGVQLTEFDSLAVAKFGRAADSLTPLQRQLLLSEEITNRVTRNLGRAAEDTRGTFEKLRDSISGPFLSVVEAFGDGVGQWDRAIGQADKALAGFIRNSLEQFGAPAGVVNFFVRELTDRQKELANATNEANNSIQAQQIALQVDSANFLANTSQVRQAEDAFRSLDRARVDGARQVQEAQIRLSRAIQDALHRETELRIRNARAAEDAARDVGRALQDITRAQEQNALSLASAQARFEEAQIQSFRAIRTAQERLEDFLRDSARRREDIQRRIARAREQEVKDLTEAIIAIEDAQREGDAEGENRARRNLARLQQEERGNKALEDALRDLARLQEDTVRQRQRLERALLESQLDAGRRQQQATRDLARARIEANNRIIEAERRLQDATQRQSRAAADAARSMARLAVENQRAIADAQRAIENASRNMARSVDDASRALQRMAQGIGLTVDQMRRLIQHAQFLQEAIAMFGFNPFNSGSQFFPGIIGLQHGGRYQFGQPFIAGEVGPELVIPDQSGRVLSNEELVRLMRDSGGGGGPSITINEVAGDPEATAFAVNSRLARGIS